MKCYRCLWFAVRVMLSGMITSILMTLHLLCLYRTECGHRGHQTKSDGFRVQIFHGIDDLTM
jgi:hypothetical protein